MFGKLWLAKETKVIGNQHEIEILLYKYVLYFFCIILFSRGDI